MTDQTQTVVDTLPSYYTCCRITARQYRRYAYDCRRMNRPEQAKWWLSLARLSTLESWRMRQTGSDIPVLF